MMTASAKSRTEAIRSALEIDGWLTPAEAGALYDLARQSSGPIVEIGCWKGRSTIALCLGSMAGTEQPIYSVDNFQGVPPNNRLTDKGNHVGWRSSSPELLRANLDKVGVNGQLRIIPKGSQEAIDDVPGEIGLLFVDGDHHTEAAKRDLEMYLPKVMEGGVVVIHDVSTDDPGVVEAVDAVLMPQADKWLLRRVDSAIVAVKKSVESLSIGIGLPGTEFCVGSLRGVAQATRKHQVTLFDSGINGFDCMNSVWAQALTAFDEGSITHFAMLHDDVSPEVGWLDILVEELVGVDLVSTVIPIKDSRGVTSTGIGNPKDRWRAFRRFTMREVMDMPETFGLEDTPHPDKFLLHNTGCWVCDLRNPLFRATNGGGELLAFFDFPTRIVKEGKKWVRQRESEDWFFSRRLWELGARTRVTRKVRLSHEGKALYPNDRPWGTYKTDEDTEWNEKRQQG